MVPTEGNPNSMTAPHQRFWSKVEVGDCWLWTAGLLTQGYGSYWHDGKTRRAHRFAYELLVGPVPDGLVLDHLCRVKNCVNPDHLEPVPSQVNVKRGYNRHKVRNACHLGHEYTEANTRRTAGHRECRECGRIKQQAIRDKRKAAA
jgi:hypothetical protein